VFLGNRLGVTGEWHAAIGVLRMKDVEVFGEGYGLGRRSVWRMVDQCGSMSISVAVCRSVWPYVDQCGSMSISVALCRSVWHKDGKVRMRCARRWKSQQSKAGITMMNGRAESGGGMVFEEPLR
jgi:hypothetical protein